MGTRLINVTAPGNQAANEENKPQPAVFVETGLRDSLSFLSNSDRWRTKEPIETNIKKKGVKV
jgi:hypothetical protein